MSEWIPFSEVDFSDVKLNQYNVDTRDFHCNFYKSTDLGLVDLSFIDKHPNRFIHTADEVRELLGRLYTESGEDGRWRFLELESKMDHVRNWTLKYIRIYRVDNGLVVCNSNNRALNKEVLSCKVDLSHLNKY